MTKNMKLFLEKVSADKELQKRLNTMNQADLIALAKELGLQLAEADFETANEEEISDDELSAIHGGASGNDEQALLDMYDCSGNLGMQNCHCTLGGGGRDDENGDICACVGGGHGDRGANRCICVAVGFGTDDEI